MGILWDSSASIRFTEILSFHQSPLSRFFKIRQFTLQYSSGFFRMLRDSSEILDVSGDSAAVSNAPLDGCWTTFFRDPRGLFSCLNEQLRSGLMHGRLWDGALRVTSSLCWQASYKSTFFFQAHLSWVRHRILMNHRVFFDRRILSDSLGFSRILSDSLGYPSISLDSLRFPWILSDSHRFLWMNSELSYSDVPETDCSSWQPPLDHRTIPIVQSSLFEAEFQTLFSGILPNAERLGFLKHPRPKLHHSSSSLTDCLPCSKVKDSGFLERFGVLTSVPASLHFLFCSLFLLFVLILPLFLFFVLFRAFWSTSLNFDESPGTTLLRFVSSPHCLFRNSLQRLNDDFLLLSSIFRAFLLRFAPACVRVCVPKCVRVCTSVYECVCVLLSIIGGGYSRCVFQCFLVSFDLLAQSLQLFDGWLAFSCSQFAGQKVFHQIPNVIHTHHPPPLLSLLPRSVSSGSSSKILPAGHLLCSICSFRFFWGRCGILEYQSNQWNIMVIRAKKNIKPGGNSGAFQTFYGNTERRSVYLSAADRSLI